MDLDSLRSGGKPALAAALAALERRPDAAENLALLNAAYAAPQAHVIGVTGPPGVGKSTLTGAVIAALRAQGRSVGVIAVDPSSRRSGGALLGDRTRLATDPEDAGIFVRSMAARDRLGGLAELTVAAMVVMRAVFDVVLIETVGVGQSETDVVEAVDTVLFCVQPGAGDSLQFMKAGIVEIPHVIAVTKGDVGAAARRACADVRGALSLADAEGDGWSVPVLTVSALRREGIEELIEALDSHGRWLEQEGRLAAQRQAQAAFWLAEAVRERFGREGVKRAGTLTLAPGDSPFARLAAISSELAR
ncbi:methylmalonyl Co-A mutase-associated GTPase MeaB [Rhodospirillaceae bacterium SYSU D60014]|uniref:methylmalonyl Co-A mutase-associated GTPase MeaB n=1 Tax=Virgifigura deserti TaxID=2268457 RepID=UPI000E66AEA5